MSSLTTTTINTINGTTNLTLSTGNTSGPAIVVTSETDIAIRANTTANVFIANSTAIRANAATTIANTLSVSANVDITGNVTANVYTANSITVVNAVISTNTLSLGSSSAAANGYTRLPNGILFQWGSVTGVTSAAGSITFPAAFNTVYSFTATGTANTVGNGHIAVTSLSTTAASVRSGNGTGQTVYWMGIGV